MNKVKQPSTLKEASAICAKNFVKGLIFLYLLICSAQSIFAQVNLQTGSATYSLPMFSWQDDKSRLNSVVALNYNSGNGLKVNDVASNEGQGWSLVAGGVITRMQVGEPDDQKAYYNGIGTGVAESAIVNGEHDVTKYPAGMLYKQAPAGCASALATYPTYGSMNQIYSEHNITAEDNQADYFSFQFNGKSGMFVIDLTNGGTGWPLGDTKMKISFQTDNTMATNNANGIRTTIKSFTITDVDGLIYKFGVVGSGNTLSQLQPYCGLNQVLQTQFCDNTLTNVAAQPTFYGGGVFNQKGFVNPQYVNPWVIGSWYLAEIDDPFITGRKITFSYNSLNINNTAGADITDNEGSTGYAIISHKTSITYTPEIAQINFPDGHLVNFNYAAASRIDYNGEKALASVDIKYTDNSKSGGGSRFLSEYQLNTTYFILNRYGTPISLYEKSVARLCLKSVKKIGVDLKEDTPPYTFDYYLNSSTTNTDDFVPPPFCYAKDIYGYYNGNNSVSYNSLAIPLTANVTTLTFDALKGLCFMRAATHNTVIAPNPKTNYAQNGLLRQVVYPTGGAIVYTYTQNINSSGSADGGVHVSQTNSTDGGYSNGCANPIITQYNYVMNGTGSASSLWGTETPLSSMTMNSHYQRQHVTRHWSLSCLLTCCKWHFLYPGIISQYQAVSLSDFQNFMNAIAPVLDVVGVISDIMDIATVAGGSTGVLAIASLVIDIIGSVLSAFLGCGDGAQNTTTTIFYASNLNDISPLPRQFKRVEIVQSPGGIGKTVQTFTSDNDYAIWVPAGQNTSLSTKQRYAPWAYGLPDSTMVYDVNGNLIKETVNIYSFLCSSGSQTSSMTTRTLASAANSTNVAAQPAATAPTTTACAMLKEQLPIAQSCKCVVTQNTSERDDWWSRASTVSGDGNYGDPQTYHLTNFSNAGAYEAINVDAYNFYTGRVNLLTTYERVYRTTDVTQYVQTETDYTYNSTYNYDVNQITTIQSNGDVNYKNIRYSSDYSTGILTTLTAKNIVSLPVETNTYVIKATTGATQYLSEKVTEYTQLSNLDIKPLRVLEQRFAQPASSITLYQGPGISSNPAYHQTQTFTYGSTGNLIGMQDDGGQLVYGGNTTGANVVGHIVANIYDYNDKYIVASVINADPVADMPAYTSFETPSLGGWTLTGTATYITTTAASGSTSLALGSGNTLTAPLNSAKPYIVSFWATTSGISVSGGTLVKSAPTINGFTYYEYNLAQGATTVTVSGTSTIDELRLYPQTARMRTTTYDPLIGKTSECDENNRITYYQYDNLGRLRFIQDEYKNVLNMYEYNTVSASKLNGCPATYSNPLITETFTKSNCGAGYLPGTITYQVVAGTYTSTISQADADAQAENDLLTHGQANADAFTGTGACALIYYNLAQTQYFTTQSCAEGYIGGSVAYTVPAGRYSTTVSQDSANAMAAADILANGQAFANNITNTATYCTIDNTPDWESSDPPVYTCNGTSEYLQLTDVNPNSPTYNQTKTVNIGVGDGVCPAGTYFNVAASRTFTTACTAGTGSVVTYSVPADTYSSATSQAAADAQAQAELTADGQAYANFVGTCTPYSIGFTGSAPNLSTQGFSSVTHSGNITGPAGAVVKVTITLNSSDAGATLTGNVGGNTVNLSGSGNHSSPVYNITLPANGLSAWSLTLSGTLSSTSPYVSSNITVTQ